ncbi:tetratricopeptide repeat protein [bacterium]|nr:MAG: tetratricopeptide repeat protein [bacterium]
MASIFIYNRTRGKCVELCTPRIAEEDIAQLKSALPNNLEGISFASPIDSFEDKTVSEVRIEDRESRVAEYLKSIGNKLEQLQQMPGAIRFYDLAFRLSGSSEVLMMKARALSQYGQADQATRLLNRVADKHPDAPEPHFMYGKLALSRADYAQAQAHFAAAQSRLRASNVEHKRLAEILAVYERFVAIYLDRDQLFTRDLEHDACVAEIRRLRQRAQALMRDIHSHSSAEIQGMGFFLETQDKIFEKWLDEMGAPREESPA